MDEDSWDVFCGQEVGGSLWVGFHLAHSLAERGRFVRLFTDGVQELSIVQTGIDPDLWVQFNAGFQLIDHRVAPWCAPARHLVQVLGSPIVKSYLSRFTSQPVPSHWIDVAPPWSPRPSAVPLNPVETTSSFRSYLAKIGDLPPGAGYVRQHSQPYAPLDRWSRRRGQGALLHMLGLAPHLLDQDLPVFVATGSAVQIEPWMQMLSAQATGTCAFVPAGPLQARLSATLRLAPAATGVVVIGSLTVVFLPLLTWSVLDELIGCCEVMLTDQADLLLRGAMNGVPVLWGPDDVPITDVLDWSLAGAADEVRGVMLEAAQALRSGERLAAAWQQLVVSIIVVQTAAARASARMQRATEMADVLIAGVSDATAYPLETMFSPTAPTGLSER